MRTQILFFFLTLSAIFSFGQKKHFKLEGVLNDTIGAVIDANVINLRTKDGTFSNDFGHFSIRVKIGDTLQISSVQHITKQRVVSHQDHEDGIIQIFMPLNRLELKEVVLKENQLTKRLEIDAKMREQTVEERRKSELRTMMEAAPKAGVFKAIGSQPEDRGMAGEITKRVDPTKGFRGFGIGFALGKKKNKTKLKIQRLESENEFFNRVIGLVGPDFFDTLEIPKNLVTHFLRGCEMYQLRRLCQKQQVLPMMNYLEKKSLEYLKNGYKIDKKEKNKP